MNQRYMSCQQAATYIGISRNSLYYLAPLVFQSEGATVLVSESEIKRRGRGPQGRVLGMRVLSG